MSVMEQGSVDRIVYRWPRSRLVRPLGVVLVVLGATWVAVLAAVAVAGHADASAPYAALTAVSLLVAVVAGALLSRPPAVLELDSDGYALHHLRGGGVQAARWSDVLTVSTGESAAGPVLVFHGKADRRSVVPLALLGHEAQDAAAEVRRRLDDAYGYRPL